MQITAVQYKAINKGKLLGEATITMDEQFDIDVKVINGSNGKYFAYPAREYMRGEEKKSWPLNRWKSRELADAFVIAVIKRIPELSQQDSYGGF